MFPSLYVALGFLCWWLAMRRIEAARRRNRRTVAAYVFMEEGLTLLSVYVVIKMDSVAAVALYAVGSAIGAYYGTGKRRTRR